MMGSIASSENPKIRVTATRNGFSTLPSRSILSVSGVRPIRNINSSRNAYSATSEITYSNLTTERFVAIMAGFVQMFKKVLR